MMKINELIVRLREIKRDHGNLRVCTFNEDDWDIEDAAPQLLAVRTSYRADAAGVKDGAETGERVVLL